MANPTKLSQRKLEKKIVDSLASRKAPKTTAKLYKQWCANERKVTKPRKAPKVKGAKR